MKTGDAMNTTHPVSVSIPFNPRPSTTSKYICPDGDPVPVSPRQHGRKWLVIQPVLCGQKNLPMICIGIWWLAEDGFHYPGPKYLLVHRAEAPGLTQALPGLVGLEASRQGQPAGTTTTTSRRRSSGGASNQDRALMLLADGWGPEDLHDKLFPGDSDSAKKVKEVGKALRRCGLLMPKDWILTDEGEARNKMLLVSQGESRGEMSQVGA